MVYGMLIRKVINIKIQYSKVSSYKKWDVGERIQYIINDVYDRLTTIRTFHIYCTRRDRVGLYNK